MHLLHRTCHNGALTIKGKSSERGRRRDRPKSVPESSTGNIQYLRHLCSAYVNIDSRDSPSLLLQHHLSSIPFHFLLSVFSNSSLVPFLSSFRLFELVTPSFPFLFPSFRTRHSFFSFLQREKEGGTVRGEPNLASRLRDIRRREKPPLELSEQSSLRSTIRYTHRERSNRVNGGMHCAVIWV